MKRKIIVKGKEYIAELTKNDKWYVVECKKLHSFSQGKTINSALHNIKEASELMTEVLYDKGSNNIRI